MVTHYETGKTRDKTNRKIQGSSKWNASIPGTRTQQHKRDHNIRTKILENKINSEIKQKSNDARSSERLLDGKRTYSGRTNSCYTDEATRRRGRCRHNGGGEGKNKGKDKANTQQEGREKWRKRAPSYFRRWSWHGCPFDLEIGFGNLATSFAVSCLLSSIAVSSVSTAAFASPPPIK